METITNYKLKDFLLVEDLETANNYIALLELIEPVEILNEKPLLQLQDLTFGQVENVRHILENPTWMNVIEAVRLITGLEENEIFELRIIDFYPIWNGIKRQAEKLAAIEENELGDEEVMIEYEIVNAAQRMARFGALNIINALACNDVTKWKMIEELPYMVVFTKRVMDKERSMINKEVNELLKKKPQV
jgi:hypothetical protein